jgi:hypothetical protein
MCHEISQHGTASFTSPLKEVMLSPLKINRPQPGLNLQTLGTMASMITTDGNFFIMFVVPLYDSVRTAG